MTIPLYIPPAYGLSQTQSGWPDIDRPATEAELRSALADVDQLTRSLQDDLTRYRKHLQVALWRQGYGPYHPLFRTSLNGFEQDQIDLEDLDEFKMGELAYVLQDMGTALSPDPFCDWRKVQKSLAEFEERMNNARRVVARSNIFLADSDQNIPPGILRQLRKHWLVIEERATAVFEHAMAVRAVEFDDGEIVPMPANVRRIYGGGRYAVICAFSVCTTQPSAGGEGGRIPLVQ